MDRQTYRWIRVWIDEVTNGWMNQKTDRQRVSE